MPCAHGRESRYAPAGTGCGNTDWASGAALTSVPDPTVMVSPSPFCHGAGVLNAALAVTWAQYWLSPIVQPFAVVTALQ